MNAALDARVAVHFLAEEMPFGGVGASGMGAYLKWLIRP